MIEIGWLRFTPAQFNKICSFMYASLLSAFLILILWLIGERFDFFEGAVLALIWSNVYWTCGGADNRSAR